MRTPHTQAHVNTYAYMYPENSDAVTLNAIAALHAHEAHFGMLIRTMCHALPRTTGRMGACAFCVCMTTWIHDVSLYFI